MGRLPRFTVDDVRVLRKEGYLVMSIPDTSFVQDRARIVFEGLELIHSEPKLRDLLLHDRPKNKDSDGRLVQGCHEIPADQMRQVNFVSFADARFADYIQNARPDFDLRPIFEAFDELNEYARQCLSSLAQTIDALTSREMESIIDKRFISVGKCMNNPQTKTITSATTYLARSGTEQTSPRPNTAAFAIYWLAKNNPGMRVMNLHGEWADLSAIEVDPSKAIIIPGAELSLVMNRRIVESMHPIYPQKEDAMRSTLRTFTYFKRKIIRLLEDKQEKSIDDLLF